MMFYMLYHSDVLQKRLCSYLGCAVCCDIDMVTDNNLLLVWWCRVVWSMA